MKIIDNFLPKHIWELFSRPDIWDGKHQAFWEIGKKPKNLFNQISYEIWKKYIEQTKTSAYGIETWTNQSIGPNESPLGWHTDKDEELYERTEEMAHPIYGAVLYGHTETPKGGLLQIGGEDGEEDVFVEPIPNRLILFNPSVRHKVCSLQSGYRRTMATNLWNRKLETWRGEWIF